MRGQAVVLGDGHLAWGCYTIAAHWETLEPNGIISYVENKSEIICDYARV